jgi:hypothetical protein
MPVGEGLVALPISPLNPDKTPFTTMNEFFFSGGSITNSPRRKMATTAVDRSKLKPSMYVERKADGQHLFIEKDKFHDALHTKLIAPEEARTLTITTPQGTSNVAMTHAYLERLDDESFRGLEIVKYVPGANCMDRAAVTRGVLHILGHTEDIVKTMSLADKEAMLMKEWEQRVEKEQSEPAAAVKKPAVEPKKPAAKKPAPSKTED